MCEGLARKRNTPYEANTDRVNQMSGPSFHSGVMYGGAMYGGAMCEAAMCEAEISADDPAPPDQLALLP